ncbi:MAG: YbaN family protein [Novosphingobium sp.]
MVRPLYLTGGLLALALGIVGAFLPIMPTVPFLILAAFFFARSKPEWEQRLLDHPQYGPTLRDWRARGAIRRRVKLIAIGGMCVGALFTWLTIGWPWVAISLAIIVFVGGWIWTRPE